MLGELAVSNVHGREHARIRRALQPLFSPAAIRGYLPQIQAIAEEFAEQWIERGTVTGQWGAAARGWLCAGPSDDAAQRPPTAP